MVLETEWVLRFSSALSTPVIVNALKNVLGLPQVTLEDTPAVAEAIGLCAAGMDFADALHLCSNREAKSFATFDKRMKQRANKTAPGRLVEMA